MSPMRWVGRRRERRRGSAGAPSAPELHDLGFECERFLAGRYDRYLVGAGRPVPAWARLNPVAHGTREEIAAMASDPDDEDSIDGAERSWQEVQSAMARELLWVSEATGLSVSRIQRERLHPLESLLTVGRYHDDLAPRRLQAVVAGVLHQHPSGSPRP